MSSQPSGGQPTATGPATPGVGEIRTYRGRTVQELIPKIRAELGDNAIILRERQGLTGGLGGFFAQRCVEIEAQAAPRVSVLADDAFVDEELELDDAAFEAASRPAGAAAPAPVAAPDPAPAQAPAPAPTDPFARVLALPETQAFAANVAAAPDPFAAFTAAVADEPAAPAPAAPAPQAPTYIAFDELAPEPACTAPAPAPAASMRMRAVTNPVAIPIPVPVRPAAPEGRVSVFRPVAIESRPTAPDAEDPLGGAASPLIRRLVQHGIGLAFAERLIAGARERAGDASDLAAAALADLRVVLPAPAPLPTTGAIAVVGPAGAGKTRVVAALAAAHARAGHPVSVARLGAPERSHELAELLSQEAVEVVPAMRTRATVRAVGSVRQRSLAIVDTTSAAGSDSAAIEVLAETLAPFALDGVLLAVPATMTARAITKLTEGFVPLAPTELVATHVDEAESLGTVAEAAIAARIPLGHAHCGLVVSNAISELDPVALAEDLLR